MNSIDSVDVALGLSQRSRMFHVSEGVKKTSRLFPRQLCGFDRPETLE